MSETTWVIEYAKSSIILQDSITEYPFKQPEQSPPHTCVKKATLQQLKTDNSDDNPIT